jgi:uncharacterized protein YeaO (DUF488 family)
MTIRLKRIYETSDTADGYRVLVERLWPRGVSKANAHIDLWEKDAGASTELRTWFAHDPAKWEEFRVRYFREMEARPEVVTELTHLLHDHGTVTFLYSAHDEEHNNAVALKEFLELMKGRNS